MDLNELYRKVKKCNDSGNFEPALLLLRTAAQQILKEDKMPIPHKSIEYFLNMCYSTIVYGVNYMRESIWTDKMGDIADEIMRTGLQIIRKYDIQNLKIKISFVRSVASIERNPAIVKALDEERSILVEKMIALEERQKL